MTNVYLNIYYTFLCLFLYVIRLFINMTNISLHTLYIISILSYPTLKSYLNSPCHVYFLSFLFFFPLLRWPKYVSSYSIILNIYIALYIILVTCIYYYILILHMFISHLYDIVSLFLDGSRQISYCIILYMYASLLLYIPHHILISITSTLLYPTPTLFLDGSR